MRIKQIYVSPGLKAFADRMYQKYDLVPYTNPNEPAIIYGVFKASPTILQKHKSMAVILWAGTDVLRLLEAYRSPVWHSSTVFRNIAEFPNYFHVCRSNILKRDFDELRMQYRFVRVSPVIPENFPLSPLGFDVYCYGAEKKPEVYGGDWIEQLKIDFPHIRFRGNCLEHETFVPYSQMYNVYKQCFMGLRLTKHDGLPNTVLELALMGRRCVYNDDLPGSIPYQTYEDVKAAIEQEYVKIHQRGDEQIRAQTVDMLHITNDWLQTEWYEGKQC